LTKVLSAEQGRTWDQCSGVDNQSNGFYEGLRAGCTIWRSLGGQVGIEGPAKRCYIQEQAAASITSLTVQAHNYFHNYFE